MGPFLPGGNLVLVAAVATITALAATACVQFPDRPADPEVVRVLSDEAGKSENRYYADNGIPEFQEAAARYLEKVYGVKGLEPLEHIIHGIGSNVSGRGGRCWPAAGPVGSFVKRRTHRWLPPMVWRWPIGPEPYCVIWNSCSFIQLRCMSPARRACW